MKIKDGYHLREVGGVNVVVAIGEAARDFHGIANLNDTGAFLFKALKDGATAEALADALTEAFEVERDVAARDVTAFLTELQHAGMLAD